MDTTTERREKKTQLRLFLPRKTKIRPFSPGNDGEGCPRLIALLRTLFTPRFGYDVADEAAQQAAVIACRYRKNGKIAGVADLDGWLIEVCLNCCLKIVQAQQRREFHEQAKQIEATPSPQEIKRRQQERAMREALEDSIPELPGDVQRLATCYWLAGMMPKALASKFRVTVGSIKGQLRRAAELLRPELRKHGFDICEKKRAPKSR